MDPNATMECITDLLLTMGELGKSKEIRADLRSATNDLVDWLDSGGFEPNWGEYPAATRYFRGIHS